MQLKYLSVLLPLPFDRPFTYATEEADIRTGSLVSVSFKHKELVGLVVSVEEQPPKGLDPSKVKFILEKKRYEFSNNFIRFILWFASYNLISSGLAYKMAISNCLFKERKEELPTAREKFNLPKLNTEQEKVALFLKKQINKHSCTVLEGATGSGKTEVYLSAIQEVLKSGSQALILLPEIVLTTQLLARFKERLGDNIPIQWHSGLTPLARKKTWQGVQEGSVKLVVGARSALFLPFKNLKLVVIDEEHDSSFKQESGAVYNARDMAVVRSHIEGIPIILSSATPSIETHYNIKRGKYKHCYLSSRYGESTLPELKVVDVSRSPADSWVSQELQQEVTSTIEAKQQALLFLNRRGYAPLTMCRNCGYKVECPNCNVWLIDHRKRNILQCHYCGHQISRFSSCPKCGDEEKVVSIGPGVERIHEEVTRLFPHARIALLTSDTIQTYKQASEAIQQVIKGEVDIIIGTQMIAKGLHFPKLKLVGIIDADIDMVSGDIRAMERTYQLLNQVSGRAGRESNDGKVLIQTRDPSNPVFGYLINNEREKFISFELEARQKSASPPFTRLAIIHASALQEQKVSKYMSQLADCAPNIDGLSVIGPAPAPILMLKKRYRYRFILKARRSVNVQSIITQWLSQVNCPGTVRVKVDIDPYTFI